MPKTVSIHDVEALHATEKALRCEIPSPRGGFEAWVPLSQIDEESEVRNMGDHGTLIVTTWWYHASKTDKQFGEQTRRSPARDRGPLERAKELVVKLTPAEQTELVEFLEPIRREGPELNPNGVDITDAVPF